MKVLYTFDDDNKTNCLARWPQILDIRTVNLDENTQIGVIELKTCIQAIVSASPELVARLGQDYTIYAYDYSEYETPLVGQGMLSWALASSSATPSAPANQSRTIVTGRVCKSVMGLFSGNSQETLEVKLRLVPVPTVLQSEYIESMQKYRDISKMMPQGFDSAAWMSFLQANPGLGRLASDQSRSQSPANTMAQKDTFGIEQVQRLLSQASGSHPSEEHRILPQLQPQSDKYSSAEAMAQLPRVGSPALSVQSTSSQRTRGRPPRTTSETTTRGRGRPRKDAARRNSIDTGCAVNEDRNEDEPSKKRAKITKTDWPGSNAFGKQPESLRVAASTAASVRIHQPAAVRPSVNPANSLEGPPRAPTPIPESTNPMKRSLLARAQSSLRCESSVAGTAAYQSPYPPSEEIRRPPESEIMTSPEGTRVDSASQTPLDLASSPPAYPVGSTVASSPNFPAYNGDIDSGFMSGTLEDFLNADDLRTLTNLDHDFTENYRKEPELPVVPASQEQPSHKNPITSNFDVRDNFELPRQPTRQAHGPTGLNRTISSGNLLEPRSDPVRPSGLHRAQTWSGQQEQHPCSDAPNAPSSSDAPERPRSRSGSHSGVGAKRRKAIQSKLATSVAAGEMPPFCENCGAIETPTWRKAWVKVHSGTPDHVQISEEEGGIVAWQTLQTDENGDVSLYRIVKRTLLTGDEGFTEILLCNRELKLVFTPLQWLTLNSSLWIVVAHTQVHAAEEHMGENTTRSR